MHEPGRYDCGGDEFSPHTRAPKLVDMFGVRSRRSFHIATAATAFAHQDAPAAAQSSHPEVPPGVQMALNWKIESVNRRVTIVAAGAVAHADVEACLDAVSSAGALPYGKLIDCRRIELAIDHEAVLATGFRIRQHHDAPVGPLAIVLPAAPSESFNRLLGFFAAADRPMRVFLTCRKAERWLDSMTRPACTSSVGPVTAPAR